MGSTPSARQADSAGLAGGPASASMAPIPNPADLTRAERVRYYGHKYDHLPEPKAPRARGDDAAPSYPLIVRRRADGSLEVSMRPIANPEDMSAAERRRVYGNRYAPRPTVGWSPRRLWRDDAAPKPAAKVAVAPAKPVVARPAPKPVVAAPVAKPTAPLKTAPVVAPAAIAPAATARSAPKLTPAEQLSAAVRPEVMKGAVLTVPEGLAKGEEAKVSLALPANLMDVIRREAAKLGLGKAAKKAEVSASLTGDGYDITPSAAQTQALKAGEAARFDWNVKPGAGDKAPLKATVDGALTGDKTAKTSFSLASLEQAVTPVVENAKAAAKGFKLPSFSLPELSLKSLAIPGMKPVTLPGVGQVQSEKLVGAGLALLALLLVIAMARNASAGRARAERRRKFRTMQDYGRVEADPEPASVSQPYVNPMMAAAGGVAAGAAVAHAAHDDHGHDAHAPAAQDDHAHHADDHHAPQGHDAHGHDAHAAHPASHHPEPAAHDDHGHADHHGPAAHAEDHGHGHDAHGHDDHAPHDDHAAHPVSHHPEPAAHDDHGHDDHGHDSHDGHGDAHADHGHDAHGHHDAHDHHKTPEHA